MKTYVTKIGDLYVTATGELSTSQLDAMRRDIVHGLSAPRFVRVRQRRNETTPLTEDVLPGLPEDNGF